MSTEQHFKVTKFDTTERWREGWPRRFHYQVDQTETGRTVGFLVINHYLETKQVEVDDLEAHYLDPHKAQQVGVHVLQACGRDLRLQAVPELRFSEPMQSQIVMAREAFGTDALQIARAATDHSVRRPYPQTLDELIAQTPQEFEPLTESNRLDMWIDLRTQDMTNWPDADLYRE
jgi:hypothetical protein